MIYFNPSLFIPYAFQPAVVNAAGPMAAFYRSVASGNGVRAMQDLMEAPLTEEGLDLLEPLATGFDYYHEGGRMREILGQIRDDLNGFMGRGWKAAAITNQFLGLGRLFAEHHSDFQTLTELMRKKDDAIARKVFGEERPALVEARRFLRPMDGKSLKGDELLWSILRFDNNREVALSVGIPLGTLASTLSKAKKTDSDIAEALRLRRLNQNVHNEVARADTFRYFNLTDDRTHLLGLALILGAELLSREGLYSEVGRDGLVNVAIEWEQNDVHYITAFPDGPFGYQAGTTAIILRRIWEHQELRRRMAA